ncbi:MAG: hypothetical protein RQ741_13060 [Wenzhouxiangellaceae bacterium]|nr:hypothetical protein [Wenzhouxiangellaceae bacterium]
MRQHSDQQQRQSEIKRQLAKDWERGDELIETGRKKVERGQNRIDKAEKELEKGTEEVEQGTRQIAEGQRLKAESERRFRARFPDLEIDPDNIER